jgi:hypothetical protein
MSAATPTSLAPQAAPDCPVAIRAATEAPLISVMLSPRLRPACEAGLSSKTCITRICPVSIDVESPKPMN